MKLKKKKYYNYFTLIISYLICLFSIVILIMILINFYTFNRTIHTVKVKPFAVANSVYNINTYSSQMYNSMLKLVLENTNFNYDELLSDIKKNKNYIENNYKYLQLNYEGDKNDLIYLKNQLNEIYNIYNNILSNINSYSKDEINNNLIIVYNINITNIYKASDKIQIYTKNNMNDIIKESENLIHKIILVSGIVLFSLITSCIYIHYILMQQMKKNKQKKDLINITENINNGFCIYNVRRNVIEYISENIEDFIGVNSNNIKENFQNISKYTEPDLIQEIKEIIESKVISDILLDTEFLYTNPKTKISNWMRLKMFPVNEESETIRYIFVINDINELKKRELLLKDSLINSQNAYEDKTEFLSRISHDIKIPLNSITGMTYIALNKIHNPKEVKDCLIKILNASNALFNLVNSNLDLTKMINGKFISNYEIFYLKEVTDSIEEVIRLQAVAKNLNFYIMNEYHDSLIGDSNILKRILLNLLSNSVKFTMNGGTIYLKINKISDIENNVIIRFMVSDTGIGIREDFIDKLYMPFEQELRYPLKNEGSGLGMSIVKNLVLLMNGSIEVQSKVNKGTTFTVEIPFYINNKNKSNEINHNKFDSLESYDLSTKRFLIVDDNQLNLEICSEILKMTGAKVSCAFNGKEAIEVFKKSQIGYYDAVFLDINMPVLNGYETAKMIRKLDRGDSVTVKIIALSANNFSEDVSKAYENGMDMHLSKPINITNLYEKLQEL